MSLLLHGSREFSISFYSTHGFLVYLILQTQSIIILTKQAQQKNLHIRSMKRDHFQKKN